MINTTASATEAELGGLFENFQKATSIQISLAEMGHPQPPTTVATDKKSVNRTVNGTEKQKISISIDMIFYWVCNIIPKQLPIFREEGKKTCRVVSKTSPGMAPQNYETKIF